MKIQGVVNGDSGELRWLGVGDVEYRRRLNNDGGHGELLVAMRQEAELISAGHDLDFEIVDSFELKQQSGAPDPRLSSVEHLRTRRAAGEHLCFFCMHEQVCAVQIPLRASTPSLIVISGCSSFSAIEASDG